MSQGRPSSTSKPWRVVGGDLRIDLVADELVAGIDVGAADDDDVERAAGFGFVEGPGGGALGVAGGEVRGEHGAAEANRVAVVEDAIDVRGREVHDLVGGVVEVGAAAGLDD